MSRFEPGKYELVTLTRGSQIARLASDEAREIHDMAFRVPRLITTERKVVFRVLELNNGQIVDRLGRAVNSTFILMRSLVP